MTQRSRFGDPRSLVLGVAGLCVVAAFFLLSRTGSEVGSIERASQDSRSAEESRGEGSPDLAVEPMTKTDDSTARELVAAAPAKDRANPFAQPPREVRPAFDVEVRDANGAEVDAILTRVVAMNAEESLAMRLLTNEHGVARYDLEAARVLFHDRPQDQRYAVTADVEYTEFARTERTLAEMMAEPTKLVLPPLCCVKVTLVRGALPFTEKAKVRLLRYDEQVSGTNSGERNPRTARICESATTDGVATFPRVKAGDRVGVDVEYEGGNFTTPLSDFVMTPSGTTLEMKIDLTSAASFMLRAIAQRTGTGQPIVSGHLSMQWIVGGDPKESNLLDVVRCVDAAGRIRFTWPAAIPLQRPVFLRIEAYDFTASEASDFDIGGALIDLSPFAAPGEHELPDVRLVAPHIAVKGVVLDSKGSPVDSAAIVAIDKNGFQRIEDVCEESGVFQLVTSSISPTFTIVARSPGLGHSKAIVASRGDDLTLRLQGVGRCEGTIRGARKGASVVLSFTDSAGPLPAVDLGSRFVTPIDGERFSFDDVDAGVLDLTFVVNGQSVITLDHVRIPDGGITDDPRLKTLEIR